jgi:hypothetical protein
MKNSSTFFLAIITCVISFIEVIVAKTQISTITADILFIVTGFTALTIKLKNKSVLLPMPIKIMSHRKYQRK